MAPSLGVFRDLVNEDEPYLSKLEALKKNVIAVRPADKGGGTVILDHDSFNDEMNRILSDKDTYCPLPSNPTYKYKKGVTANC